MFYSHEILTSREHGVATIWLVATLGSKSQTSKVNRKAILDVDVPKACGMITHPEAPMALRLQGNLLYGVSKVYSQQCGYALMDAQNVKDRMWTMLKAMRSGGLDPDAGKARPDQLVLPHDPAFVPELMLPGLNVDLSVLEALGHIETPRKSSLLSSYLPHSNKSSRLPGEQLRLNLSSSGINGGFIGFPSEMSSPRKEPEIELPAFTGEETGVLLQPDFEFDEEGNIIELPMMQSRQDIPFNESRGSEQRRMNEVRDPANLDIVEDQDQFEGQVPIGDDMEMRDVGEEAPLDHDHNLELNDTDVNNEATDGPAVQMRQKRRAVKAMELDDPPELRNSDLAQWNYEYAQNMAVASKLKESNKMFTVAKKNAAFWVMGIGVASVGVGIGTSRMAHPLEAFSGEQLLGALTGKPLKTSRRKRNRDSANEPDLDGEARNVRQKVDGNELGRGDGFDTEDAPDFLHDDIEVGREAPPSLHDDNSSQMPWNITASVQSSRHGSALGSHLALSGAGPYTSIGRPRSAINSGVDGASNIGSVAIGPRTGRLTSASPLAGRGTMPSRLDLSRDQDTDLESLNGIEVGDGYANQDGQLGFASAKKKTRPLWLSKNLGQESINFYKFIKDHIGDEADNMGVTFSSLFPPESNSSAVATQAFLHVLTLGTSGALCIRQKSVVHAGGAEDAGEIFIGPI